MNKIRSFFTLLLLMIGLCLSTLQAQSYNSLWKQVEQAQKKSLPQTVVKLTGQIYRKAEQEKNVPQMLKAYLCREAYQERLTPDSLYVNLRNLENWAKSEQNPVSKAILHSLLAREYADYMRYNRQLLSGRTALDTDEAPADIREWSSNIFVTKVDEHNLASLQDSVRLLEVSSKEYVPFVVLEDGSRFYGHDMYHLLAARAVDTYLLLDGFRATLMLASKNGIDNVSMSQIATQLGIKKPSLYNHFRSKDEIVKAMYDYLRTQAKEKLKITDLDYGKLVKDKSLEEVLKLMVHNYCKMSTQSEMFSFYKIIYSTRTTNVVAAQIMCEETEKMILATKNLFYALQVHQKIFVKDIDQAAISFTMTIHSLIDYQLDRKSAGNKFNEDILDNYICWFSKEFGGKDEKNID